MLFSNQPLIEGKLAQWELRQLFFILQNNPLFNLRKLLFGALCRVLHANERATFHPGFIF